ncbi:MAG: succinate dehydrogenase, cytochrome b556 subunit [Alphaproteobacteria bacterium]
MSDKCRKAQRPTSPHLQAYRLPLTAILSITHRMTGAGLSLGMILIAAFLLAAATGEEYYNATMNIITSPFGIIIMFLWSLALYFHTFNGIRHMIWDTGRLLEADKAMRSNYYVIAATLITTFGTWAFACPAFPW